METTGAITSYIDVAQVALYAFWVFFAGLIFYIRQEDRREGYPLESEDGKLENHGLWLPAPKTFELMHGHGSVKAPNFVRDSETLGAPKAKRIAPFPGAPLEPTGNPMVDGVGPAAWAKRADVPDLTMHGDAKIVPMRVNKHGFGVTPDTIDPRGMAVVGCDKRIAGTITDLWVDQSESVVRYYEVELKDGGQHVLLPHNFSIIRSKRKQVYVDAITSKQFSLVPVTKSPEQITLLEEEKVMAYYGGGTLYATPTRSEPIL